MDAQTSSLGAGSNPSATEATSNVTPAQPTPPPIQPVAGSSMQPIVAGPRMHIWPVVIGTALIVTLIFAVARK